MKRWLVYRYTVFADVVAVEEGERKMILVYGFHMVRVCLR